MESPAHVQPQNNPQLMDIILGDTKIGLAGSMHFDYYSNEGSHVISHLKSLTHFPDAICVVSDINYHETKLIISWAIFRFPLIETAVTIIIPLEH